MNRVEREEFIEAARRANDTSPNPGRAMTGASARDWMVAQAKGN